MSRVVNSVGPTNAKIFLVGEAPGSNEELEGKPFVGGAGKLLNRLLMEAGMIRGECRIGNVMRVRPAGNNFGHFYYDKSRKIPKQELLDGIVYIKEEIRKCNPNVVVALGNEPLRALTGEMGITNWRGSILFSKELGCKIIPTIHPANLLRAWNNVPLVMFDMKRIRDESQSPDWSLRERDFPLRLSFEQVMKELIRMRTVKRISFDVETNYDGHITAIALADSPWYALSIPITNSSGAPYWIEEEEAEIWKAIKVVMENPDIETIAQNAQFDIIMFRINPYHINIKNLWMDTMCAHHTVYPEMAASESQLTGKHIIGGGKSLGLLCSIYTRQPYYKHWGKSGNDEIYWKYNCMDAAVTFEIAERLEREMKEFGVLDFYYKFVHPLIPILLETQMDGVKINHTIRQEAYDSYLRETEVLEEKLNGAIGRIVNVQSPKQLAELLYKDLGFPTKYKRGTAKVTTDELAIAELAAKYSSPVFDLILKIRQNRKLLGTYLSDKGGEDGRIRCSYVIGGTETGRLSSRKSVFGTGMNLQNIPPGVCRRMFIPDNEDTVFIESDLSQAEARIVAYEAEEGRMIEVFESGGDIHQLTADSLPAGFKPTGSAYENIPNPVRLFAKKHVHAFNYGEGVMMFAKRARIQKSLATAIRNGYLDKFFNIKAWQLRIQSELNRSRTMTTAMGRRRTFFGMWGDALFRSAYAFKPQATVADLLNLALIRFMGSVPKGKQWKNRLQVHDSFVTQCSRSEVEECIEMIRKAFDITIRINGRDVRIPVEFKVGNNWDEMKEVK